MKRITQLFLQVLCLWAGASSLYAQQYVVGDSLLLQVQVVRTNANTTLLRLAPRNYTTWQWGNQFGYRVMRYTLSSGGTSTPPEHLGETELHWLVKPFDQSQFKELALQNPLAAIAYGAIYEATFEASSGGATDIISAANIGKERDNRYGFSLFAADQSLDVARAMALVLVDEQTHEEDSYLYAVYPAGNPDEYKVIATTGEAVVKEKEFLDLPIPPAPTAVGGDHLATLQWNISDLEKAYTTYRVERSPEEGGGYEPVNQSPLVYTEATGKLPYEMLYVDALPDNTHPYYYRVVGYSPMLGDYGKPSAPVMVIGKEALITERPSVRDLVIEDNSNMHLTWEFSLESQQKIKFFKVEYTNSLDNETYEPVSAEILREQREWFYADLQTGYYRVVAFDGLGNAFPSLPQLAQLNDVTPPAPPEGISGSVTKQGEVTLQWTPNSETDLLGYQVLTSDHADGEYAALSTTYFNEPRFSYTLDPHTLAHEVFIQIKALDKRENISLPSAPYALTLPDITPPAQPVLVSLSPDSVGIDIVWRGSSSKDVKKHQIQRRTLGNPTWETLSAIPSPNTKQGFTYQDTTVAAFHLYDYRIEAIDHANLTAYSNTIRVKALGNGFRPGVLNLDAYFDVLKKNQVVKVTWAYPDYANIYDFVVYRSSSLFPQPVLVNAYTPSDIDYATVGATIPITNGTVGTGPIKGSGNGNSSTGGGTGPIKGGGGTGTGSNGGSNNPPATLPKGAIQYLVEDRDDQLYLIAHKGGWVAYQVLVRYNDGSTSKLSGAVQAH